MCDSDSELVKITRSKSKPKSGSSWFRKKPKDKSSKEQAVEKRDEDLTASVARGLVLPSGDAAVIAGSDIDVGETGEEEGTSSISQVCKCRKELPVTSSLHSRKKPRSLCSVNE